MSTRPLALAAVLLLGTALAAEAQSPRIAYIDSQAILDEAPGAQEARQAFQQEMDGFQQEIQRMENELERLINQYQQQERTLSTEAREARQEEIRRKEMEYQQRVQQMEVQASERQRELVEPILDRMADTIEEIRAEGNYALIFDVAGRSIIAADPALDLTSQVIQRLQTNGGTGNP
jgi:outer membrane protein